MEEEERRVAEETMERQKLEEELMLYKTPSENMLVGIENTSEPVERLVCTCGGNKRENRENRENRDSGAEVEEEKAQEKAMERDQRILSFPLLLPYHRYSMVASGTLHPSPVVYSPPPRIMHTSPTPQVKKIFETRNKSKSRVKVK